MEFHKTPKGWKVEPTFKIQTPPCLVIDFHEEWKTLTLDVPDDFVQTWRALEAKVPPQDYPWNSAVHGPSPRLKVKIDDMTMFFDHNSRLVEPGVEIGSLVTAIIEIRSIYNFKEMAGFTSRVHQLKKLEGASKEWQGESGYTPKGLGKCLL